MFCSVLFCFVMLCYVMLCYVMLCYVMLCYVMLCYVMLCYVMLCYATLCYAMLCYVMLCYAMLSAPLCSVLFCSSKTQCCTRWDPCKPHEPCYLGSQVIWASKLDRLKCYKNTAETQLFAAFLNRHQLLLWHLSSFNGASTDTGKFLSQHELVIACPVKCGI